MEGFLTLFTHIYIYVHMGFVGKFILMLESILSDVKLEGLCFLQAKINCQMQQYESHALGWYQVVLNFEISIIPQIQVRSSFREMAAIWTKLWK